MGFPNHAAEEGSAAGTQSIMASKTRILSGISIGLIVLVVFAGFIYAKRSSGVGARKFFGVPDVCKGTPTDSFLEEVQ